MYLYEEPKFVQEALQVTAKFGYLRKDFFWKYLSAPSRSAKFRAWSILMNSGYLKNYDRPVIADDVFKLSKRGIRILREAGVNPVSAAHPLHMEHDDIVVHFALSFAKLNLIGSDWLSDKMLKQMDREIRESLLGNSLRQSEKIPDLLFSIEKGGTVWSCALEIERTRKDEKRYIDFVLDYSRSKNIRLILVAYKHESVKKIIEDHSKRWNQGSDQVFVFLKIKDLLSIPSVEALTEVLRTASPTEFSHSRVESAASSIGNSLEIRDPLSSCSASCGSSPLPTNKLMKRGNETAELLERGRIQND